MADPVEVAIESALIDRLLALTFDPPIPVSLPNISFTEPAGGQNARWLRATFLPADTFSLGVDPGASNQHFGLLQVDVFYGLGSGEYAPVRVAAAVMAWFKRGTRLSKGGFTVQVTKTPYRRSMSDDGAWAMIPVSIPYLAFASNPA